MPSENYLVTFTTAANLAGVDALKASMLGLNVQTVALAAAIFAVYEVGKAGVENFKKQEVATDLLTQAYATQKDMLSAHTAEIQNFLSVNARFISDQYDTQEAFAAVIRAGYDTTAALRIMGDALDLAAIRHIPVTDAEKQLILAMAGNKRAVKDLLGDTVAFDKIQNDKTLPTAEKHRRILKLVEDRIKGGRDAIDETAQKQSELNKHWQDFTAHTGPAVLGVFKKLTEAADTLVQILDLYVQLLEEAYRLSGIGVGSGPPLAHGAASGAAKKHKAGGGSVMAGEAYTVGEKGIETFVPDTDGSIIPNGGGGGYHVHIHVDQGAYIDGPSIDRLANLILQRARYAPGT